MNKSVERESGIELLRIIAQVMIIFYHILLVGIYPTTGEAIYKAIWIPAHIGVPLFVIISGYFGIKPSIKGLVKLLGLMFVLQIPYHVMAYQAGEFSLTKAVLFMSWTPFWFMRTYLFLYLLSPLLNKFLKDITSVERIILFLVLFYISDIAGFTNADFTLRAGKNIVTFMLFYVVGNTIKEYKPKWEGGALLKYVIPIFVIINTLLVLAFSRMGFSNTRIDEIFYRVFIDYNSIFILPNSVIFFMIFAQLKFHSSFVNGVAKGAIAMYILHGTFISSLICPVALTLFNYNSNPVFVLTTTCLLAVLVALLCSFVYWLLTPVWNVINKVGSLAQQQFDRKFFTDFENE